jgi:K+ transporter
VLAVTRAEALYADLGHFGRKPIIRICDVTRMTGVGGQAGAVG